MRRSLAVAFAFIALSSLTMAAEVRTSALTQHQLINGVMQWTGGSKTVTVSSPDRTEVTCYKVSRDGETPVSRTTTVREAREKEAVTVVSKEKYEDKEFVLYERLTTISRQGSAETVTELLQDGRLLPVKRTVQTVELSPGIVDAHTITEERKKDVLLVISEVRVIRIDFSVASLDDLPGGEDLRFVEFARRGIQSITINKAPIDGALKVVSISSQLDQ